MKCSSLMVNILQLKLRQLRYFSEGLFAISLSNSLLKIGQLSSMEYSFWELFEADYLEIASMQLLKVKTEGCFEVACRVEVFMSDSLISFEDFLLERGDTLFILSFLLGDSSYSFLLSYFYNFYCFYFIFSLCNIVYCSFSFFTLN